VGEEWIEANLLPIATRNSYFEDILLDSLIAEIGETRIESFADAETLCRAKLSTWVSMDSAAVASNATRRIALRMLLFCKNQKIEKDTKLGRLLKIADKTLTVKNPIIVQGYEGGISNLVITFPDFDESDEATLKSVSHLIAFAASLHGTKAERCALIKDKAYGDGKITISSSMNKLIDVLTSSAHHPQGLCLGEVHTFSSGFKGNYAGILAAMRLLNHKSEFLRRRKYAKDSPKSPVSFNSLQETFNTMSGLRTDNSLAYTLNCVKAILSSCVKVHNKGFPGGWIHASRSINGVKSDFALANLLGWTEKVPSQHKMMEVLFNTVDLPNETTGAKKAQVINITQDKRNFTHREFRTAVALTLPRISFERKKIADDVKADPFSVRSLTICNNFCSDKRDLLVDRLNESYGLKVSLKNPKSKTREIHYKMSRDRLLAESANMPLKNAEGENFKTFSDLPKAIQKYFRDTYRYPIKRQLEEDVEITDAPQEEASEETSSLARGSTLKKKRKFTRGQVTEQTRKSGRLAAQKDKN
jgi:hypothetical protein